jgi:hypothetical protein
MSVTLQHSIFFWFYIGCVVALFLIKWPRNPATWTLALLAAAWMYTGYSSAVSSKPSRSLVYSNGVWLLPEAQARLPELNANLMVDGIAYSENDYLENCQQKTGLQLLGFPKVKRVWTYLESRWCSDTASAVPATYEFSASNTSRDCQKVLQEIFIKPEAALQCMQKPDKSLENRGWSILLNCSQSSREYQLRWRMPNMLTGGDALESFAGVNFNEGQCLDPTHAVIIVSLLDVVGLGLGAAQYSQNSK